MTVPELVSIVVPCYNKERYVAEAVRSVLNQTYKQIEIIVVDDGSTDGSASEIARFADHIQAIRTSNHGACHARNLGSSISSGQYIMFLDADDAIDPDVIAGLVEVIGTCEDVIGVCEWAFLRRHPDGRWQLQASSAPVRPLPPDPLAAWLEGWYVPSCAVLWPANALKLTNGWDEQLQANQDGDLMMRALLRGLQLVASHRGTAHYRKDPRTGSITRHLDLATFTSRLAVLEKMDSALREAGRREVYRLALGHAYYGLVRAHLGTLPGHHLREAARRGTVLAGAEALPRSLAHRLPYWLLGVHGLVWAGKALALARSFRSTSTRQGVGEG